jgi:predicted Zn-dependent protease
MSGNDEREDLLERAQDLAKLGDLAEAKETLRVIVSKWPDWPPGWHILAIVTLRMDDLEDGLQYALRSRQLSPQSRKVSKVLFNALWKTMIATGDPKFAYEAMAELNRMLSRRESPDHRNAALEIRQQFIQLDDPGVRDGLLMVWDEQLAHFFEN